MESHKLSPRHLGNSPIKSKLETPPSGVYSPSHILQKYDESLFAKQSWTNLKLLPEGKAKRETVINLSGIGSTRKPIIEEVKVPRMRKMIKVSKTAAGTSCKKRDLKYEDCYMSEEFSAKIQFDKQFVDEKKRLLLDFIRVKQKFEKDHPEKKPSIRLV